MIYNLSDPLSNVTNIVQVVHVIGTSMEDPFLIGNLTVLAFGLILFITSYRGEFTKSVMTSSFLTTILALLLAYSGVYAFSYLAVPFIVFIVSGLAYFTTT